MTDPRAEVRDRLRKATAARKRAEATLERIRKELADAMYDADQVGVKQREVVEDTGYNREHIRRIVREEERRRSGADMLWVNDKGIAIVETKAHPPSDSH